MQLAKLKDSIRGNFLFLKIPEEKRDMLLDAFVQRNVRFGTLPTHSLPPNVSISVAVKLFPPCPPPTPAPEDPDLDPD